MARVTVAPERITVPGMARKLTVTLARCGSTLGAGLPAVIVTPVTAVYEVDRQDAAVVMDPANLEKYVTATLLDGLAEALRPHVILTKEPDLERGRTVYRMIIQAVRPGA